MLSLTEPAGFSPTPTSVAGCLIYRFENEVLEVLLLQQVKGNQLWGFPGGKIREGETPYDGMCREVYEETGLFVQVRSVQYINRYYVRNDFGDFIYALYAMQLPPHSEINLNPKEHKDFGWFSDTEARQVNTIPHTIDCIEKFESSEYSM